MRYKQLKLIGFFCALSGTAQAQHLGNIFNDNLFSEATGVVSDLMDTLMPGVTNIRIGLGPVMSPAYEGASKKDISVAPLISLRYKDLLQVDNNQIRVNVFGRDGALLQSSRFRAGPMVKIDFGRKEKDSPDLRGLGNVGTAFEIGAFVSYDLGPFRYRIRARHDLASGHKGTLADFDINLAVYRTKTVSIGAVLGTTWANSKYTNTFFGITAAQAKASGLPTYTAGAGLKDIAFSVGSEVKVTPSWAIVLNAGAERLLSKTKSSPLIAKRGNPNQFTLGAFGVYSF